MAKPGFLALARLRWQVSDLSPVWTSYWFVENLSQNERLSRSGVISVWRALGSLPSKDRKKVRKQLKYTVLAHDAEGPRPVVMSLWHAQLSRSAAPSLAECELSLGRCDKLPACGQQPWSHSLCKSTLTSRFHLSIKTVCIIVSSVIMLFFYDKHC